MTSSIEHQAMDTLKRARTANERAQGRHQRTFKSFADVAAQMRLIEPQRPNSN